MRRAVVSVLCLLGVLGLSRPAMAVIGTIDEVPAATLLLPYFEVDVSDSRGTKSLNTVFTINNASATAILARVIVWSDLSVPVLGFHVYLTGYDVQRVDMRRVLHGILPRTASDGQDPTDTISPQGATSQDINFASCHGLLPLPAQLSADIVDAVQDALTGRFVPAYNGCVARPSGRIARGYVTVDTINNCTLRVPGDPGYFGAGGTGDATNQNVLWGDFIQQDSRGQTGGTLVHIEASATDPETSTPGEYTFYGRYVAWTAADNREPLATTFAAPYSSAVPFSLGTRLVAWRDSKVDQGPFVCGGSPAWYPLGQEQIVIFDDQENPLVPPPIPVSPPPVTPQLLIPFPAEAQLVAVGGPDFPVPFVSGWVYLNLNTTVPAAGANPPEDPAAAQAWISVRQFGAGRTRQSYGAGFNAIQLDNATSASHMPVGF